MKVAQGILAALALISPQALEACTCKTPTDMASALSGQRNVVGVVIDEEMKSSNGSDRLFRGYLSTVVKTLDFLAAESTLVVKTEADPCGLDLQVGSSYVLFGAVQRVPLDGLSFQPVLIIDSCAPQRQFAELTGEEANLLSGASARIFGTPNSGSGGIGSGGIGSGGGGPGGGSGGPGSGFPGFPNGVPVPGPPGAGPSFGPGPDSPTTSPVPDFPNNVPTFGSSPVVVPTPGPTEQPTTPSPTEFPTTSPVTPSPTAHPTKSPTKQPSSGPTKRPVPAPVPKPPAPVVKPTTPKPQCYVDSDCGYYSFCKYGVCIVERPHGGTPTHGADHCKYSVDCGYGAECIDGRCHTVAAERPPTSCIYNSECGGGDAICLGGMCHYKGYQYDTDKCYYDVDCEYGYVCAAGYCEKDDRYSPGTHRDQGYDKTCRYSSECSYGDICKGGLCLPGHLAQTKDKSYGGGYRKLYHSVRGVGDYHQHSLRLDHTKPHSYGNQATHPYVPSGIAFSNEVCKRDEDCGREKGFCGSGVCLAHGQCVSNDDCYNPSNYVGPGVRGLAESVCVEGTCEQHLCIVADCIGASPCDQASCGDYYESCVVDYCGTECTPRFFNRIGEAVCQ